MGNKCCQIEEVASILNIIKALVENVSTSISTQTAITTIQQYINHFNGNLISDFRLEPDNRTITIELANGNTFPLVLDRVVDVQLNQAGTAIDITYSNASLNHSIPFPTFNGIAISNPSNVVLSGNGTSGTPLTAEARIEHNNTSNTTIIGDGTLSNPLQVDITVSHQNSPTIAITGDGTQSNPLVAEYIGPSVAPIPIIYQRVDYFLRGWYDGLNQIDMIPVTKYSKSTRWIDSVTESQLYSIDLSFSNAPDPRLRIFKDVFNRIIEVTGEVYLPYKSDTEFPVIGGALFILDPLTNTTILESPSDNDGVFGALSGFYNFNGSGGQWEDFDSTLLVNGSAISGSARMIPNNNKILLIVYPSRNIADLSSNQHGNLFVTFSLKYKY